MIHCRPDTEACSPREIVGNAMFTIVSSSPIMNKLRQHMPRTARRRRRLSWGTATTFYSAVRLNSGQPPQLTCPAGHQLYRHSKNNAATRRTQVWDAHKLPHSTNFLVGLDSRSCVGSCVTAGYL